MPTCKLASMLASNLDCSQASNVASKIDHLRTIQSACYDDNGRWFLRTTKPWTPIRGGNLIYALTNSKGGVGKSTLSTHFVVWLTERGHSVAFIDTDVQRSSSVWLREAAPAIPVYRLQTPDDLLEQVPAIAGRFKDIVVDGPAGLSEVTRTILFVADVAFLPCGPSVLDLRAANDAIRVVRQAQAIRKGPPRAILVPNKLQVHYRLSREFLETTTSLEIPSSSGLRLRQPYADAAGQGTVVWRMGARANAAAREIQGLFEELTNETGDETKHEPGIAAH